MDSDREEDTRQVHRTRKEYWYEHFNFCVLAYNTPRQEFTLYLPFHVMFGRLAQLPIEVNTNKKREAEFLMRNQS